MTAEAPRKGLPPGLSSGLLFFAFVLGGCGYILYSKFHAFSALYVTLGPVLIMLAYAALLGFARLFRLRDDQSGDNLYYMGFLFTLTSLAVSLYQFSTGGSADQIVQNFGIAIGSTIAGIWLRIMFNQMRRDPIEVEHVARLELADASRRVKRELESTVLEFSYFRRATQQSISDAVEEITIALQDARKNFVKELQEFAATSSAPIKEASERSGETIEKFNVRAATAVEGAAKKVADESDQLSKSTAAIVSAIDGMAKKLAAMQTPDQIIEIKLNPTIQGLSRVVNTFGKSADAQAKAIDDGLKQTHGLTRDLTVALERIAALEASRQAHNEAQVKAAEGRLKQTSQLASNLAVAMERIAVLETNARASGTGETPTPQSENVALSDVGVGVGRGKWTAR